MPEKGWKSVSLPEELYDRVEGLVKEAPQYTSIAEFIRAAIWRLIRESEALDQSEGAVELKAVAQSG